MTKPAYVVAIDGPSGSGKSTITKMVAQKCNLTYLDTGAMFRAIAFYLNEKGIKPEEIKKAELALKQVRFEYASSEDNLVEINGKNLTKKIREHNISDLASSYGQNESVRSYLKGIQRIIASKRPSILEGRDIGTVVFPNAILKYYLRADAKIRAERRLVQLKEISPNKTFDFNSILKDIEERDERDQNREIAPLKKASDALEIDSTKLTINEVVDLVVAKISQIPELKI